MQIHTYTYIYIIHIHIYIYTSCEHNVEAQANTANRSKAQESSPWPRETAFGVRNEQHHWSSMRHSNSDLGMVVFLNQPWEMCVWFGSDVLFFICFAFFLLGRQDPQSWSYVNVSFYFVEMGVTAWDRRWIWQNHPRWSYELRAANHMIVLPRVQACPT